MKNNDTSVHFAFSHLSLFVLVGGGRGEILYMFNDEKIKHVEVLLPDRQ